MFDVLRNLWCYLDTSAIKAIKKNLLVFSITSLIAVKYIFDSAALKLSKSEIKKKPWNHSYRVRVSHPQLHVEKLSEKNQQFLSAAVVSFIWVCPSSAPSTGTNKAFSSTAPNKVAGECISQKGGRLRGAIKWHYGAIKWFYSIMNVRKHDGDQLIINRFIICVNLFLVWKTFELNLSTNLVSSSFLFCNR